MEEQFDLVIHASTGIDSRHDIKKARRCLTAFSIRVSLRKLRNPIGILIHKLFFLLVLSTLTLPAAGTTIKTRYVIDDGHGFWSTEAPQTGQSAEGNPGTTLGEQRKYAHEFAVRLAERIVWVEDHHPFLQYTLVTEDLGHAAIAHGASGAPVQKPGDARPYFYPKRLFCPEADPCAEGWIDMEPDRGFARVDNALRGGYRFIRSGHADIEYDAGLNGFAVPHGAFVGVGVHEHLHHLGFFSYIDAGNAYMHDGGVWGVASPQPFTALSKLDQFVRHHGATPRNTVDMTLAQLNAITAEGQDVRFAGTQTLLAAPLLLAAGFDDTAASATYGEVYLHTSGSPHSGCGGSSALAHLAGIVGARDERGGPPMVACGGSARHLNIAAYMLSDMGWGPVVDSTIGVAVDQDTATIEVAVGAALEGFDKAVADNLLVSIDLPDGVQVESASTAPADCDLGTVPFTCRFASLDSAASIALTLGGVPGVHAVTVDVDHQAAHVDPEPVNNFASALITVGENTITSTTLDDNTVPENEAADTRVGAFVVASTGGAAVSHSFALVDGSGSNHNACFRIDGADLLTTKAFDHEAQSSLNIRVETLASNGFTQATAFTVAVTDVGGASAWVPSLVQPVYAGDTSPETAQHATLPAALLLLGLILLAARQRRMVVRYGALVLLGATLLVACGGGGGGSDSGPAPTPAPPVATFFCS